MRWPKPCERDMFAWYCKECVTLLYCHVHETGTHGFETFWPAENEAVRTFNTEPKLRRCRNCGTEHPLGYRFMAHKNSPEEEAARQLW
jgi:RNase P subunit RPR2